MATLVRDVNETVQFLAPSQDVRVELVHYETHAFPDIGKPQEVIDRQDPRRLRPLPRDHVGPGRDPHRVDTLSGTIHEFDHTLAHRHEHGWPVIMFFFCDEKIDFPPSPGGGHPAPAGARVPAASRHDRLHRHLHQPRRLSRHALVHGGPGAWPTSSSRPRHNAHR